MMCRKSIEIRIVKKGGSDSKEEEEREANTAWKKEKGNGRDNELSKRYENVEEEAKQGERNCLLSDLTDICLNYLIQNDL